MSLPMSPARFGSGLIYAVWMSGMTDESGAASPEILASESTMDELYAEANATDQILKFNGIEVDGVLSDGRPQKMLVGVGRAPIEGTLVRYHDQFTGAREDDDGEDDAPQAPAPRESGSAPSPFRVS